MRLDETEWEDSQGHTDTKPNSWTCGPSPCFMPCLFPRLALEWSHVLLLRWKQPYGSKWTLICPSDSYAWKHVAHEKEKSWFYLGSLYSYLSHTLAAQDLLHTIRAVHEEDKFSTVHWCFHFWNIWIETHHWRWSSHQTTYMERTKSIVVNLSSE